MHLSALQAHSILMVAAGLEWLSLVACMNTEQPRCAKPSRHALTSSCSLFLGATCVASSTLVCTKSLPLLRPIRGALSRGTSGALRRSLGAGLAAACIDAAAFQLGLSVQLAAD